MTAPNPSPCDGLVFILPPEMNRNKQIGILTIEGAEYTIKIATPSGEETGLAEAGNPGVPLTSGFIFKKVTG